MCKSRADEEKSVTMDIMRYDTANSLSNRSVQHRIQSLERDLGPLEQQHRAAEQRVRGIKNEITRTMVRFHLDIHKLDADEKYDRNNPRMHGSLSRRHRSRERSFLPP